MKKILIFVITSSLVLSGLGAVGVSFDVNKQFMESLDQYQTIMTENCVLPIGQIPIPENPQNLQLAQSFIPTLPVLTKVELFIGKNSTAIYDLNIAVRDDLTGTDLTFINIDPSAVPTGTYDWVSIDFDDISVATGHTYYIVAYTENTTDNFYVWGGNNESDSYVDGCLWLSLDDGGTWGNRSVTSKPSNIYVKPRHGGVPKLDEYPTWDTCFKTYGIENSAPDDPEINGPSSGKPGTTYDFTIVSTDPEGDDITYCCDWGDGSGEVCIGPYPSGATTTISHKWTSSGKYILKVKASDIYGAESDYTELEITMPRNRVTTHNAILLRFMQHFPRASQLIRYFFGV